MVKVVGPVPELSFLQPLYAWGGKKAKFRDWTIVKATTCTLALAKGVHEKLIMERTRPRSVKSLKKYQRVSAKEQEAVSDVLHLSKKSFLEEDISEPPQWKIALDRSSMDTSSSSTPAFQTVYYWRGIFDIIPCENKRTRAMW